MKRLTQKLGLLSRLANILFIVAFFGLVEVLHPFSWAAAKHTLQAPEIKGYHLVSENEGWLLLGDRLYWTKTGGATWAEITPPTSDPFSLEDIFFLDARAGWLILARRAESGLAPTAVAHTLDGGATWQVTPLSLPASSSNDPPVAAFFIDFIDLRTGWLVVQHASGSNFSSGALYMTTDGGMTWEQRTLPIGEPVYFVSPDLGWTAGGPRGDALYRTTDGGRTWYLQAVQNSRAQQEQEPYFRLPSFGNERQGTLPVVLPENGKAVLMFYITQDAGQSWQEAISIPLEREISSAGDIPLSVLPDGGWVAIEPALGQVLHSTQTVVSVVHSPDTRLAGIVDMDMPTDRAGWARVETGDCAPVENPLSAYNQISLTIQQCKTTTGLLRTDDGGLSWTSLNLPGLAAQRNGDHLVTREMVFTSRVQPLQGDGTNRQDPKLTRVMSGQGFDKCEITSLNKFQAWATSSPYRAVNLYIGGSNRACSNSGLSYALISMIEKLNWTFIPTWVGPQASCTSYPSRMSSDPLIAYDQGIAEAEAALDVAANLGLTDWDKSGAIVYYDLEYYNLKNVTCREAAEAFISGWTTQLRARGNLAGVYANGPQLSSFAGMSQVPDAIWPAHWIDTTYNPDATVWDVYKLSNDLWANHQRVRQYTGGHRETWGDVSMVIDSNVIDGIVSVSLPDRDYFPLILR